MRNNIKQKIVYLILSLISTLSLIAIFYPNQMDFLCYALLCKEDTTMTAVIFSITAMLLICKIFKLSHKYIYYLLFIDLLIFFLPKSSDYIIPSREDVMNYFNLVFVFCFLVISWVPFFKENRKNKHPSPSSATITTVIKK